MFSEIINNKSFDFDKLLDFGFQKSVVTNANTSLDEVVFSYKTKILDDSFELTVIITATNEVETCLLDLDSNEPYTLYKSSQSGTYLGEIRNAIASILEEVVKKCAIETKFKATQTQRIIKWVQENFNGELEFLWPKFSEYAVFRRSDNKSQKWYLGVFTVQKYKVVGKDSKKVATNDLSLKAKVEILDIKSNLIDADFFDKYKNFYPGWHMNKKSWFSVIMDDSVSDEVIQEFILESYNLAK